MTHIKVTIRNKEPETIEEREGWTAEGWLAAMRSSDGKYLVLNAASYLKEDIIDAVEVKPRRGFTNMEGI